MVKFFWCIFYINIIINTTISIHYESLDLSLIRIQIKICLLWLLPAYLGGSRWRRLSKLNNWSHRGSLSCTEYWFPSIWPFLLSVRLTSLVIATTLAFPVSVSLTVTTKPAKSYHVTSSRQSPMEKDNRAKSYPSVSCRTMSHHITYCYIV